MKRRLGDKEGQLTSSLWKYGFAATIEVTNALVEPQEKIDQSLVAKSYLEQLADGGAKIHAGLAYNGNQVRSDNMNCLDFVMDLTCYDPARLENVAHEMVYGKHLAPSYTGLIEKMLANCGEDMPLASFFAISNIDACSLIVGETPKGYCKLLSIIKGFCMELYIQSLFSERLSDRVIYHRHKYKYRKDNGTEKKDNDTEKKEHEADEIIICREMDFYAALEKISCDEKLDAWVRRGIPLQLANNSLVRNYR